MTPKELYEANLALIDRAIGFACRRNHLSGPEAEDFRQSVHVKLIEDDYKVFRDLRDQRVLGTYLGLVVQRHLVDWRRRMWGTKRPSAVARGLGPAAVKLEALIRRDRLSVDKACEILLTNHHVDVSRAELERIASLLPLRQEPPHLVDDQALAEQPADVKRPEEDVLASELRELYQRLLAALDKARGELPADDRLLIEMCVLRGRTIAEAARFLGLRQKPLYRRLPQVLARLRKALEAEGFSWEQVSELLGISEVRWD